MAKVYVSYRHKEQPFVSDVVSRLAPEHEILIDYRIPVGADWRNHQLEELRAADVFLVFVSRGTHSSDFQNVEIGSARFASRFLDGKLTIPVLIDDVDAPRPLQDLDYLDLRHRDPGRAAQEIREAIARQARRVRLFISHSHRDQDLASKLVDVLTSALEVPAGQLRCTSVPGYQLDLGTMAPDVLRRELGSAACVVALLTPNSLSAEWVLFELGAAWANAKLAIPLLAGTLEDKDIPGPFRGAAGGKLGAAVTLDRLIDQVERELGWRQRSDVAARQKRYDLADYAARKTFPRDPLEEQLRTSFTARRALIGSNQGRILDDITGRLRQRPYIPTDELEQRFRDVKTSLYYRLEQLRLLGFLDRTRIGDSNGEPAYGWSLSEKYRREVGL